jgi:Domain of unknown function (DUF4350)
MPSFLDSRDARYVIGALALMLVLLAITYAVSPAPAPESLGYPSTYASDWKGAKAAYLLLEGEGYRVERWERPPEELPPSGAGDVLVLVEPFEDGVSGERAAMRRFVSDGGRIVAIGASAKELVPDLNAAEPTAYDPEEKILPALLPSPITRGAPEITMSSPDTFTSSPHPWLAEYGQGDQLGVVSYRIGNGEVIWWASASPLTNGTIREKNNLEFFLNCIGPPATAHIYWDEYFHGARESIFSYFAKGALPWVGLQIGIALTAVLLTFSRRSGAMRLPATESRLSPLEFVDTLGDLYQSAHASPAAVAVAYRRFRLALSRKLAAPSKAKLSELCRAASSRFGWPEEALLDTLSRSERAMRNINLEEAEALYLVRQLHELSARLDPKGRTDQEAPAWR